MNILVSACLIGVNCRYNGVRIEPGKNILSLMKEHTLIPVCPEQLGGLSTPRACPEQRMGRVYTKSGKDVTEAFMRGAEEALRLAKLYGCTVAVLKERSPSCGAGAIYDGNFTGVLTTGDGIAARLMKNAGIKVYNESNYMEINK